METIKISLVECFRELEDPRSRYCTHNFLEILIIGLFAVMCGMEGWADMVLFAKEREKWLKETWHMSLENGIPSASTFSRTFSSIDPAKFQTCVVKWVQLVRPLMVGDVVSIDGKSCRGSRSKTKKAIHLVSAWANRNGISLAQKAVDQKTNEITAIPELLEILALKGCVVTIDAMGCQKSIAALIVEQEADYVLGLKGNQKIFAQQVKDYLTNLLDSSDRKNTEHSLYEAPAEIA